MLGEAGVDSQAGSAGEIVPKLEGQREKRKEIGSHGKKAEQAAFSRGDRRELFAGAENHRGKAGDQNRVGREPFVQQELSRGQREGQKAYGGGRNQQVASAAQTCHGRTESRPREDRAFHAKCEGDSPDFGGGITCATVMCPVERASASRVNGTRSLGHSITYSAAK